MGLYFDRCIIDKSSFTWWSKLFFCPVAMYLAVKQGSQIFTHKLLLAAVNVRAYRNKARCTRIYKIVTNLAYLLTPT